MSQDFCYISKNNTEGMSNSGRKLMQKNFGFDKLQKSSIRLVIFYRKSKQESSYAGNCIKKDLIIVDNWLLL